MSRPIAPYWLALVLIHSGLVQAGVYVVRPMVSYQALNFGADFALVGLIGATFAIAPLVLAIQIGRFVDKGLAGFATFLGPIVTLLSVGGLLLASELWHLAILLPLLGTGHLLAMVGGQTLIAQFSGDKKYERNFGLLTFYASLGHAVGPFIGGLLVVTDQDQLTVDNSLLFAGLLFFAAALLTLPIRRRLATNAATGTKGSVRKVLAVPGYKPAIFVAGATTAVVDVMLIYLPLLGTALGLSAAEIGLLLAIRAIASMLVRFILGPLGERFGVRSLLVIGSLVTMVGSILIALTTSFTILAFLLFLTGIAMGVGQPATMAWVSRISRPESMGLAISVRLTANRLGQVAIPALASSIAIAGLAGVFYLLGGLMFLATIASARWAPKVKPED